MEGRTRNTCLGGTTTRRTCARPGCFNPVNKPTAKYCSVRCCSIDPERHQRLRMQARRNGRRALLPLTHQLSLGFGTAVNAEAQLATICEGREDAPAGMSRLAG